MDKQLCDQSAVQREQADQPVESTLTRLQDMPEDCLLQIFSDKSLELMDLCCLAETCTRFKSITQRLLKNRLFDLRAANATYGPYEFSSFHYRYNPIRHFATEIEAERLLRNFAPCLEKITIETLPHQTFLFNFLKEPGYGQLHDLCIRDSQISATVAEALSLVFEQLHTFSLSDVSIEGDALLFKGLRSLHKLYLSDVQNCSVILENVFPQLDRFDYTNELQSYDDPSHLEVLTSFIARHTTIKSLDLSIKCDEIWWMNIMQAIGNSCTGLTNLSYKLIDPTSRLHISLEPLQALKSLTIVYLNSIVIEDFKVFAHMTKLETLKLRNCLLPADVAQFACLTPVKRLYLAQCASNTVYSVTDIIRTLVNLQYLNVMDLKFVGTDFVLTDEIRDEIDDIISDREYDLDVMCVVGDFWRLNDDYTASKVNKYDNIRFYTSYDTSSEISGD